MESIRIHDRFVFAGNANPREKHWLYFAYTGVDEQSRQNIVGRFVSLSKLGVQEQEQVVAKILSKTNVASEMKSSFLLPVLHAECKNDVLCVIETEPSFTNFRQWLETQTPFTGHELARFLIKASTMLRLHPVGYFHAFLDMDVTYWDRQNTLQTGAHLFGISLPASFVMSKMPAWQLQYAPPEWLSLGAQTYTDHYMLGQLLLQLMLGRLDCVSIADAENIATSKIKLQIQTLLHPDPLKRSINLASLVAAFAELEDKIVPLKGPIEARNPLHIRSLPPESEPLLVRFSHTQTNQESFPSVHKRISVKPAPSGRPSASAPVSFAPPSDESSVERTVLDGVSPFHIEDIISGESSSLLVSKIPSKPVLNNPAVPPSSTPPIDVSDERVGSIKPTLDPFETPTKKIKSSMPSAIQAQASSAMKLTLSTSSFPEGNDAPHNVTQAHPEPEANSFVLDKTMAGNNFLATHASLADSPSEPHESILHSKLTEEMPPSRAVLAMSLPPIRPSLMAPNVNASSEAPPHNDAAHNDAAQNKSDGPVNIPLPETPMHALNVTASPVGGAPLHVSGAARQSPLQSNSVHQNAGANKWFSQVTPDSKQKRREFREQRQKSLNQMPLLHFVVLMFAFSVLVVMGVISLMNWYF